MHADAEPKHYLERFAFRAPPAGTGPITFRALIKQGDTNMGAFYWPTAPATGIGGSPTAGRAGGDLILRESPGPPPVRTWGYRGGVGDTCTAVCAAQNLVCDEGALVLTDTAEELTDAIQHSFMCSPPLLRTCTVGAPRMSGMGDGLCWYRDEESCPARTGAACDVIPYNDFDDGLRLCPCVPASGRRLDGEAQQEDPSQDPLRPDVPSADVRAEAPNVSDEPCEPTDAADAPPKAKKMTHGAGGSPSRCPSLRAHAAALAAAKSDGVASNATEQRPAVPTRLLLWLSKPLIAVLVLFLLALGIATSHRRTSWRRGGKASASMVLVMAQGGSAHNWLRGIPSRASNRASTMRPCRARTQYAFPHIQVNPEQDFIMSWATGHHSSAYFVFVKAENENMLGTIGHRLLSTYFREAPPSAFSYFYGPKWDKMHLRVGRGATPPGPVIPSRPTWRLHLTEPSHPYFVQYPWAPTSIDGYRRNTPMRYGDQSRDANGVYRPYNRAAYTNARYPWIVAMHRFAVEDHQPHSADTAFFRFPPGTEPGRYVIHYWWQGYRDCVDVDVLPLSKPVANTYRAMYGYRPPGVPDNYVKTDHCQYPSHARWPIASDGTTCVNGQVQPAGTETCFAIPPIGQLNSRGQTNEEALQACKDRCSSARSNYNTFTGQVVRGSCSALNIVPLTSPPDLAFPNEQNIPWGVGGCTRGCFANEPAGTSVCYGLRERGTRAVEAPWDIVRDDPRGTRRKPNLTPDGSPPSHPAL